MTEAELLAEVIDLADQLGVLTMHVPDSRRLEVGAGFPDLVLAGLHGCIFAELKSTTGRLTPDQGRWRWKLTASGQRWVLWRPDDWPAEIERELRSIA